VPRRRSAAKSSRQRPAVLRLLGEQLRRLRLERKLSQVRLAELTGLNYKYIGRVELGKADPGAKVLVRLANGLGVSVGEIFETVTPSGGDPHRVLPADAENIKATLSTLTSTLDRMIAGQPRPLPSRAPRNSRR
jgi:transcriptional regulator with XRE-family HTH domain